MTKVYNPLMDKRRKPPEPKTMQASDQETESLIAAASGPPSPITGNPMVRALCRNVPVWVDPGSRLVLPMKKE